MNILGNIFKNSLITKVQFNSVKLCTETYTIEILIHLKHTCMVKALIKSVMHTPIRQLKYVIYFGVREILKDKLSVVRTINWNHR